jgi:ADP-ribose pyrophosphatase YjhB (NUDIX family)
MPKQFIVASGPVIIENNKVLLDKDNKDDFWKFLGGRPKEIDFESAEEPLVATCRRRVKEELGLKIEIIRHIKTMMTEKPEDPNTWVVLIHYLAKRRGEIKLGEGIKEAKWFDIDNLPPDCAPNIKPVIEEYKKSL